MTEEAAAPAESRVPSWLDQATPGGAFAGLVRIELPEDALPWRDTLDEGVLRKRAQYIAGVERIAESFGALEPLEWEGDALQLVFGGVPAAELPGHTFKVAKDLWNRVRTELDLPVKLAAHVGRVRAGAKPGVVLGGDVDACAKLVSDAPVGTIALSEELALALPEAASREVTVLGHRPGEERAVYAFPRSAVVPGVPDLILDETARLWSKFRSYATGPDVRLVRYVGFRLHKKEPPRLDILNVFVPSEVKLRKRVTAAEQRKKKALEEAPSPTPWSLPNTAGVGLEEGVRDFRDLYAHFRNLIVLGDPGSGKTTLLRWLAVIAASGSFKLDAELGVDERLLPLPVSVGRLAELRHAFIARGEAVSVPTVLSRYFHDRSVHEDEIKLRDVLVRELERGRCMVLLDGLDEVKSDERQSVHQWLESFAAEYPQNRFIASSRIVGYTGFQLPVDVAEMALSPFDEDQVERYVRAFHEAYVQWETNAPPVDQGEADRLLEALEASPRLSGLARNPFMLSALALIHRAEGKLPRHRVQAYEVFARALCETWAEARRLVAGETHQPIIEYEEEALPILGELALAMHEQYPTGVAPEEFVLGKIAETFEQQNGVSGVVAKRSARKFLERAGNEVQILLERGAGEWGFLHLTFQEFFVAAGLLSKDAFDDVVFQHLFDPRWEEVIRLGVGYLALVQKRPPAAQRFVKKVLAYEEPEPRAWFTRLLKKQVPLASLLAAEAGGALPVTLQQQIAGELAQWLVIMPRVVASPILKELALTDFAPRVALACRPLFCSNLPTARAHIASALGELHAQEDGDTLVTALSDENALVGETAAEALHNFQTRALMLRLEPMLSDARPEVRAAAFKASTPYAMEIPSLILQKALQDPNDSVRVSALFLLMHRARNEALSAAEALHSDESFPVQLARLAIFEHFSDEENLRAILHDNESPLRILAAAIALSSGDEHTDIDMFDTSPTTNEEASAEYTTSTSDNIVSNLGKLSASIRHTKKQHIANLNNPDPYTRAVAASNLKENEEALDTLLALCHDADIHTRAHAVETLGSIPSDRAREACVNALSDTHPAVRFCAALALARKKQNEALEPLINDFLRTGPLRDQAILALGEFGTADALAPLVEELQDPQVNELKSICSALCDSATAKEAPRLIAYLIASEQPSNYSDHIFRVLWTIATREAGRLPDPTN